MVTALLYDKSSSLDQDLVENSERGKTWQAY